MQLLTHLTTLPMIIDESNNHPFEGILKRTGSLEKEARDALARKRLSLSVAQYTIILLPGHPNWQPLPVSGMADGGKKRVVENVDFKFLHPEGERIHLMHSVMRRIDQPEGDSATGDNHGDWEQKRKLSVEELKVAGQNFADFVARQSAFEELLSGLSDRVQSL